MGESYNFFFFTPDQINALTMILVGGWVGAKQFDGEMLEGGDGLSPDYHFFKSPSIMLFTLPGHHFEFDTGVHNH